MWPCITVRASENRLPSGGDRLPRPWSATERAAYVEVAAVAEDGRALDDRGQLAHVARPIVAREQFQVLGEGLKGCPPMRVPACQAKWAASADIVGARAAAAGGWEDADAVPEVLAEAAGRHISSRSGCGCHRPR